MYESKVKRHPNLPAGIVIPFKTKLFNSYFSIYRITSIDEISGSVSTASFPHTTLLNPFEADFNKC